MDAFPVPWSWTDGAVLVVWSILAQYVAIIPFQLAGLDVTDGVTTLIAVIASQAVTFAGVALLLKGKGAWSWRLLGPRRPVWRHAGTGLGIGVSGFVLVIGVQFLVRAAVPNLPEPPSQPILERTAEGGTAFVLGLVTAVLVAPAVEELIFRGVFFQGLRARFGLWTGIVASGLVFGAVHLQFILAPDGSFLVGGLPAIAALSLLGMWFAAALHHTGSLVVAIVGHATFNAVSIGIVSLAPASG